ncbi:MAG: 3-methyl-2-oxobutanoate hydroxymethyltransferase [Gemmatimonadota bacterium]|nr:MAG: 3-methyl-2-oxobutanoate hydroxymethyltransferase [Gemmatimonadota bacterium]
MTSSQINVKTLLAMRRRGEKIAMVTAYDYHSARICDAAGVEMILVGDTLGMVIQGHENTLPVTVDDIVYHSRMVRRADPRALVVADMPFLSYQVSTAEAVANAGRLLKEGRAQAVKIEGGREFLNTVGALTDASIPVMGHVGLTPQSVHRFGGFRVQGRSEDSAKRLVEDAGLLERAGCFSLVLEGIPFELAREITESLSIPTIGIGAGPHCDGQVLVFHDLLGIENELKPKFVKKYADLNDVMIAAIAEYRREVKSGAFPDLDHSYGAAPRRASRADREDD